MNIYHTKYLKYKKKYIDLKNTPHHSLINSNFTDSQSGNKMSLTDDDISLIKKRIQFLTHYTSLVSFFEIIKSDYLVHVRFDVVMMSVFPVFERHRKIQYILPLEGTELTTEMHQNFNISNCHSGLIILLFDPKLLWNSEYYFSPYDNYGMPNGFPMVDLKNVLDDLGFWPEIGFYEPINITKYLTGIVIPKDYVDDDKLKSIVNQLKIRVFICSGKDIYETDHL